VCTWANYTPQKWYNTQMNSEGKLRVALGMSGGVDSSLCAHLLKEAGYDVTGVYLECWRAPGCRTEEDRKDALKVALELSIPFEVLDFKQEYKDRVVEYFFNEYEAGRTPNPDVMCNKEIKFGMFYDWAMEKGFDFVATGHYAEISGEEGEKVLATSADHKKDQTYFLYRMRAEQVAHTLFPIGHLTKFQVRAEAKKRAIPVAEKPDSQGICFIGEINVHNFLKERLGENPGEVINTKGEVMGSHKGLWFYTVGQRHGFEISGTWKSRQGETRHAMPPYYVIKKIPEKNQLVVGFGAETFQTELIVSDLHWVNGETPKSTELFVRIRHGGKLIACTINIHKTHRQLQVILDQPTQGIAEGQSAVFYQKISDSSYACLGGGVIVG
jgi:tRNA-specific 2-thiouridylase